MAGETAAVEAARTATARFRAAVQAGDLTAFAQTLAPDVVLRSPVSRKARFERRDEVSALVAVVFDVITEIEYFEDVGSERTRALFYRARVGSEVIEEATLLRLDANTKVMEITLFIRPLPGLTALTAALGPRLARRGGRARAALATAITAPLAALTRAGDAVAVRLIQPASADRSVSLD